MSDRGPAASPSILVVDDDERYCARLKQAFASHGHPDVTTAASFDEALAAAEARPPQRAVVDMRLDDEHTGFDVVRVLRGRDPQLRAIIVTNYPSLQAFRIASAVGAVDLQVKSIDVPGLLHAFSRVDHGAVDVSALQLDPPSLAEVEWEHLNRVLALVNGHATMAAKILGISRSTLYRKLEQMPVHNWSRSVYVAMEQRPKKAGAAARARIPRTRDDEPDE